MEVCHVGLGSEERVVPRSFGFARSPNVLAGSRSHVAPGDGEAFGVAAEVVWAAAKVPGAWNN